VTGDVKVLCPLVRREIADGYCLDVNLERLGLFKTDSLRQMQQETGESVAEVSIECEACPNQPLQQSTQP